MIQTDAEERSDQIHPIFRFQLPKPTLPCFSGDLLCWQTFWDSFDAAVNQNPSLSGIQKLNYLRAQVHGDAARTIAGLQLTETNYFTSVALLMDRYGQPHNLKDAHVRALLNIQAPSDKLFSLREFYDTVETHICSLSSLGQDSDTYRALLVSIILQKLSNTIICNLLELTSVIVSSFRRAFRRLVRIHSMVTFSLASTHNYITQYRNGYTVI